jgi:aquaporin Z
MFSGPISGASMNPTRSIAPAVVSLHLDHLWVYVAAPVFGAVFSVVDFSTYQARKPILTGRSDSDIIFC